jgi:iron complex transport system permease protein
LEGAGVTLILVVAVAAVLMGQSRKLDTLLLGEEAAQSLGVDPNSLRRQVVLWVSVLVGACVSAAGMIGFVGLVVPHFVRRFSGSLHARLIPLSAVWGALVLLIADVVARKIVAPSELPAGVVTALVGAPCFIWILAGRSGREGRIL